MKKQHITLPLLVVAATALSACAPVPAPNPNRPGAPSDASIDSDAPVPAPTVDSTSKLPVAHPDPQNRPNMVVSPYRPYNVIDVKGYRSGDVVGDPSTAKVNSATGKLDLSTSKHFRLP